MSMRKTNIFMLWVTLILTFMLPALLLNSMGVIILNLTTHMGVTKPAASLLEAFQGGAIIIGAFFLASFIPSFGYKKSLIIGVSLEIVACVLMWLFASYFITVIYFIFCGIGFALVKTTIFAIIGLITASPDKHASNISLLEGCFMVSMLSGFWIYSFFMEYASWTTTFLFLGVICLINLFVILFTFIDETEIHIEEKNTNNFLQKVEDMKNMIKQIIIPIVLLFIIIAFFYVFIEQGINNWLPTYKSEVLYIDPSLSVKVASLFAGGIAVGRLAGAFIIRKVKWIYVLTGGLVIAFILLAGIIYFSQKINLEGKIAYKWSQVPYVAYLIPIVGFCIAPIYPTICSLVLSSQSKRKQSSMAGLIIFFSALGGTLGSFLIGKLFGIFGGLTAIKVPLIPIVLIFFISIPFYFVVKKAQQKKQM